MMPAVKYTVHPLCNKFPTMSPDEFRDLVDDIRTNGQRDPVWVYGKILLDGKHRIEACEFLAIEPDVRQWHPKHGPEEPQIRAFVLSKNFYRRHLNAAQRAAVVIDLITTSGKGRPKSNADESAFTQEDAAKAAHVSVDTIQQVAEVLESGSKPLVDAMMGGEVSAVDASKVTNLPKSEQTAAVKAVKSGDAKTVAAAVGRNPAKQKPREPGEDPVEKKHRTPKDAPPAGTNKKLDYDDTIIEKLFGQLIRAIDARADALHQKNSAYHKTCTNRLDAFLSSFNEWKVTRR